MPRELVTVQVGQCGNQLGCRLLDLFIHEHLSAFSNNSTTTSNNNYGSSNRNSKASSSTSSGGIENSSHFASSLDSLQTVFSLLRNSNSSSSTTHSSGSSSNNNNFRSIEEIKSSMQARTVAIDMEEGVLNAMLRGPLRDVLRNCHMISDVSGAGNNWAVGHMEYGDRHGESIIESVRKTVEACDSIQAFLMMHSLSGGTGSGLGSRVLGLLNEEFPDVARFSIVVMPSMQSQDVVISPYNTCFALRELVEHADCILPLDNDALARCVDKASGKDRVRGSIEAQHHQQQNQQQNQQQSEVYSAAKPTTTKLPFDEMNAIAAQAISNLTSGVRFPGQLNLDISDIITNMVPYPRLNFLVASLAPLSAQQQRYTGTNSSRAVDAMFASCLDPDHTLVQCDYQRSTVLCSAFVCRGSDVDVGDVSRCIPRIKERMKRVWWNADGVKTAVCSQPPVGFNRSMIALQNTCAIGERIQASMNSFVKLWNAKSHFHHFQEYLEPQYFDDTLSILGDVVEQYRAMDNMGGSDGPDDEFGGGRKSNNNNFTSLKEMLKQRKAAQAELGRSIHS